MIRNEGRKPSHTISRHLEIVAYPDCRRTHHLDLRKVATRFFRTLANKTKTPLDQMRVGKLKDDAIAHATRAPQRLRPITGDPHRRNSGVGPGHLNRMAFVSDLLP